MNMSDLTEDDKSRIVLWIDKTIEAINRLEGVLRGSTGVLYNSDEGLKKKDELQLMRAKIYLEFFQYCKKLDIWKYYVDYKNSSTLDFLKNEFHQNSNGTYTNLYGDEYSYDPLTGILQQTAWGF